MSVNKVILLGRLGRDPELKYTGSGTPVVTFSLATSEYYTKDGQRQESTEWHRIVVFGKQGENCEKYLQKGSQAYIEGRIQTRDWNDKDGNKRYTTEIVASNVVFLSRSGSGGSGGGGYSDHDYSNDRGYSNQSSYNNQSPKRSNQGGYQGGYGGSPSQGNSPYDSSPSDYPNDAPSFSNSYEDDDIPF